MPNPGKIALNVMSSKKLGGSTGINRTVPTSFTTAGHYFLILKGHHLERSKNWFQHLETKKGGVFFDVAYATKISVAVRPFTVQSINFAVHQFCFFGEFQYFFFLHHPPIYAGSLKYADFENFHRPRKKYF